MIFPYFFGIVMPWRAPLTWTLFSIHFFIYFIHSLMSAPIEAKMSKYWSDDDFLHQMAVFSFYDHPNEQMPLMTVKQRRWSGDTKHNESLAVLGLIHKETLQRAIEQNLSPTLSSKAREFQSLQAKHPSMILGLSHDLATPLRFLTYQFTHASWGHLLSNMMFLVIFGAVIERLLGPILYLLFYVSSGVVAGQFYLLITPTAGSGPLVGASGAVSAFIFFVACAFATRNIPFYYFIYFSKRWHGIVYLPGSFIFLLWILTDISGAASQFGTGLGSIAHLAHIGGAAMGGLLFAVLKLTDSLELPKIHPDFNTTEYLE